MMRVSQSEVLNYANRIKEMRPNISKSDMKMLLEAKFIHGKDVFNIGSVGVVGAVANPLDWLNGIGLMLKGIASLFMGDASGVMNIIDGVLTILYD